jgi:hypothetical protein
MLRWLFNEEDRGSAPESWHAFLADNPSHLLGEQFSVEEVARQAKYLVDRGLLTAVKIEEAGPGWIYPRLTANGQDCVTGYEGKVAAYMNRQNAPGGSNFYGPYIQGNADGAQLAWGNNSVTQNQSGLQQIAPGFESLAAAVTDVLGRLPTIDMADEDREDAQAAGKEILAEVVTEEPDRGKVRRALAALKGYLLPIAAGASTGAADGIEEATRQAIEQLGSTLF